MEISPERTLWCAVLSQSLEDAMHYRLNNKSRMQEHDSWVVKGWIESRDFREVCDFAGFDWRLTKRTFTKALYGSREEYEKLRKLLNGTKSTRKIQFKEDF